MAIYHFSGTVISRSQGRSAVACSAYRAGEKLQDERYDKEHDYTHKQDVAYKEILLPEQAPAWMADREQLWNAVESHEKRKDAQLAREFNFALPRELTLEQNTQLAKEFVQEVFVNQGMVADLCIHHERKEDGEFQPHAHVMLTMREVSEAGFGPKVRAWNDKALLLSWREEWAEKANHHLAINGHDLRIDHRTLAEQGIDLEPQHKIGASLAKDRLARMEDHERIARENGEKLVADPSIALTAITRSQSTFTHQDIARFVNRHTVDAKQFTEVYEQVKGHESIVHLGQDDKGRERFSTNEMVTLESKMMAQALSLAQNADHGVSQAHQRQALADRKLSKEQRIAFDHVVSAGNVKCLVGFAGTGKSYLLGTARDAWEKEGYQVQGITLAGIAAENLEGSSGIKSRTFASRSYYWDRGEERLTKKDVLVVDEAGMLSSRQMARLMAEADQAQAKVVLVGDPQQLQAIEAGAAFRAIAEHLHYVELSDIRRQVDPWQQEATRELARGKTADALARYDAHAHVHEFTTSAQAKAALVEVWNDARLSQPQKSQIMLAYERSDVLELNEKARALRKENKELGREMMIETERGKRLFALGERVYFLKNDKSLGVKNGSLGTLLLMEGKSMIIRLDKEPVADKRRVNDQKVVRVHLDEYKHLDYGYAATIHKAQGVTVDRSYVLASKYLDAHASYVAMSRHRESADLFYGKDVFLSKDALVKTLSRERPKDVTLDYLHMRGEGQGLGENKEKAAEQNQVLSREENRKMMQEKLKAFTKEAREAHDLDRGERSKRDFAARDKQHDFSEFKKQFKTKHPELAKELERQWLPEEEKKALALMDKFKHIEGIVHEGGRTSYMAKDHLGHLAEEMSNKKEVMAYVREHDRGMEKQIHELTKSLQREKELELER